VANLWFCVRQVVHPALDLWVCCSGVVGCLAEGLLGGVDKVEETILVLLLPVQLRDWLGDRRQSCVVDQDEKCLSRVQLEPPPDDLDQFPDSHVVWNEELGLVQHRQLLLPPKPLYDTRHLVWMFLPDLLDVFDTESWNRGLEMSEEPVVGKVRRGEGSGEGV